MHPARKPMRLSDFDYTTPHAYFLTICTKERGHCLASITSTGVYQLKPMGRIAAENVETIPTHFPEVVVNQYVIMPNHVHLLLSIGCNGVEVTHSIPVIIQSYKASVSRSVGYSVWQRSYYDHVVRNEEDYRNIWQYIENNPLKWQLDRFFTAY